MYNTYIVLNNILNKIDAIRNRVNPVYQGLRAIAGLIPQADNEDAFVGIYAANSAETILTEIGTLFIIIIDKTVFLINLFNVACHSNALVTIPISSSASSSHVSHIIQKTNLKVLVTDTDLVSRILPIAKGTSLKYLVVIGDVTTENEKRAQDFGIELFSLEQIESRGKKENFEPVTAGKVSFPLFIKVCCTKSLFSKSTFSS